MHSRQTPKITNNKINEKFSFYSLFLLFFFVFFFLPLHFFFSVFHLFFFFSSPMLLRFYCFSISTICNNQTLILTNNNPCPITAMLFKFESADFFKVLFEFLDEITQFFFKTKVGALTRWCRPRWWACPHNSYRFCTWRW